MQKITPCLWFDTSAEEAMNHDVSICRNSRVGSTMRYGDAGPGPKGAVIAVTFQLEGQDFFALNGRPQFQFTQAVSLLVNCETQAEVDYLGERLAAGGQPGRCGWLKDKFGLSWQIVPAASDAAPMNQSTANMSPEQRARMEAMINIQHGVPTGSERFSVNRLVHRTPVHRD